MTSTPHHSSMLEECFGACGTVCSNRSGLSISFKTVKLKKGEVYSERAAVDDSVLCLKWMDKRAEYEKQAYDSVSSTKIVLLVCETLTC